MILYMMVLSCSADIPGPCCKDESNQLILPYEVRVNPLVVYIEASKNGTTIYLHIFRWLLRCKPEMISWHCPALVVL
jgi:hypothetical protein